MAKPSVTLMVYWAFITDYLELLAGTLGLKLAFV